MWKQVFTRTEAPRNAIESLKQTRRLLMRGGAISGCTVLFSFFYNNFEKTLRGWELSGAPIGTYIAFAVAIYLTYKITQIVDFGIEKELPESMDLLFQGKSTSFAIFLLLLCLGKIWISAYVIDYKGRSQTAQMIVKEPEFRDLDAFSATLESKKQESVNPIRAEIDKIEKRIADTERQIEKQNPASVKKIKSKEDKWGWHIKFLDKAKATATASLRKELSRKQALLDQRYTSESTIADSLLSFQLSIEKGKKDWYDNAVVYAGNFSGGFGLFCGIGVLFVQFLLSMKNAADLDDPRHFEKHDYSGVPAASPKGNAAAAPSVPPHLQPINHQTNDRNLDLFFQKILDLESKFSLQSKNLDSEQGLRTIKPKESNQNTESKSKSKSVVLDLTKAKKDCRNAYGWYVKDLRKHGKDHPTQKTRWQRFEEAKEVLEDVGYSVWIDNSNVLHIEPPK